MGNYWLLIYVIQKIYLLFHPIFAIGVFNIHLLHEKQRNLLLLLFSGRRFSYTPQNPADGEIWQHIEKLDHQGMELIEKMNLADFHSYLRSTDNTICGRYPISLLLAVCFEYNLLMNYICIFRQLIKLKRSFHQVVYQNFVCNLSNMLNQVK